MKKLIIIIEQKKCKDGGKMTKTDMVGDKELWKHIVEEVLHDLIVKNK